MSHYASYIREVTADHILETEGGFATYRYLNDDKTVYIIDIFVAPEHRRSRVSFAMIDEIVDRAKKIGCIELLGTVSCSNPKADASLKAHIAYGMTLSGAQNGAIIFRKDI